MSQAGVLGGLQFARAALQACAVRGSVA